MLRIPPTRVELKYEDMKEYENVARTWHGNTKKQNDTEKSGIIRERQDKKKQERHNRMGI